MIMSLHSLLIAALAYRVLVTVLAVALVAGEHVDTVDHHPVQSSGSVSQNSIPSTG